MSHPESRSPARDEAETFFFTNSFLPIVVGSVSGKQIDIMESDHFWVFLFLGHPGLFSTSFVDRYLNEKQNRNH